MRIKIILAFLLIIILAVCAYIIFNDITKKTSNLNDITTIQDNSTKIKPTQSPIVDFNGNLNGNLNIPQNDYVINHINWTDYPSLQTGYIYKVYVSEPTYVVPHKFIEVQIQTEVMNVDNKTEIYKEIDGVAREARNIYGPNSGINIIGTKGGIAYYFSSMLPYDDKIY